MRILIIEDHYSCVVQILKVLAPAHTTGESDNLLITFTAEGDIAEKLLEKNWDWILIDHDLPNRCAGWVLLNNSSYFRRKDKAKIIAISAVPENNKRLLQHGAHWEVAKMEPGWADIIKNIIDNNDDKKRD